MYIVIANFLVILSQRFAFLRVINSMALGVCIASAVRPTGGVSGRGGCSAVRLGIVTRPHNTHAPRTCPAAAVPEPESQGLSGTSLSGAASHLGSSLTRDTCSSGHGLTLTCQRGVCREPDPPRALVGG